MTLRVDTGGEPGIVHLVGELDIATVPLADEALTAACDEASTVVVDLSNLTFMDSSGVRLLLQRWATQRERQGDLILRQPTPTVQRLFDLLGLEENGVTVERGPNQ
jgi:anti-sigma B factor antagonist